MTTDTGLTTRLRQHSRRAGLAVGLTMALTIAICVGGFAVIYTHLQPFISDFVSQEPPVDDAIAFDVGRDEERSAPTRAPEDEEADEASAQEEQGDEEAPPADNPPPAPTEAPAPTPTPPSAGFTPDYQSTSGGSVNFRSGPGTRFESLGALPPTTPLQYLGERVPTEDPEGDLLDPGQEWMKFRTEDGTEGWIREIDTEPYEENA